MSLFIYCYNICFILLYSATMTSCIATYHETKSPFFKSFGQFFFIYILESIYIAIVGTLLRSHASQMKPLYETIYDSSIELFAAAEVFLFGKIILDLFHRRGRKLPLFWAALLVTVAALSVLFPTTLLNSFIRPNLFSFALLFFSGVYWDLLRREQDPTCRETASKLKTIIVITTIFGAFYVIENVAYTFFVSDVIDKVLPFYESQIKFSDDLHSALLSVLVILLARQHCEEHAQKKLEESVQQRMKEFYAQAEEKAKQEGDAQIAAFCKEYSLTERETEVLRLLLEGKSNQELSEELYITVGTVKAHVHSIFQKIGVFRRNQLMTAFLNYEAK